MCCVALTGSSWTCFTVDYRHEVPVTAHHIAVVHMDPELVVVDKPASIPVSGN